MALVLEWDFEQYQEGECLIALHTRFEPCKLAYWLNKILDIRLRRASNDLYDKDSDTLFALFSFSYEQEAVWHLIANRVRTMTSVGLFTQVEAYQLFIKELPQVDYFLRINPCEESADYVSLLKAQYFIDFAYEIPLFPEGKPTYKEQRKLNEIKSKLIF